MELVFNSTAKEKRVQSEFHDCMTQLQNNLKDGQKATELYISKDIYLDVKKLIEKEIEGKNISFVIVGHTVNQFTYRRESLLSEVVGDQRFCKLVYHGS